MKGVWTLTLKDLEGKVIDKRVQHNDITYLGVGQILDNVIGRANVDALSTTGSTWIGVGTGSATFTSWDSGLTTEVSGAGNLGRVHPSTVTRSNYKQLISASFDTTQGSGALTEAGIFCKGYASGNTLANPGSGLNTGLLFNKVVYGTLNKDTSNTLQIDYEVLLNE